jgi:RNA polymerase sigma-70 factor (ECF subfamily)
VRQDEFARWYEAAHPRLLLSLSALCGERDLASEATDEALARALQHWPRVRDMESPEGWLYRVGLNVLRRQLRRRRFERRLLPRLLGQSSTPAPAGEVWLLVRELPPRQRSVVVLRYVADLPEAEIAALLHITRGTVASTLAAAKRALSSQLESDPTKANR